MNYEEMMADGWKVRYEEGNKLTLMKGGWMACVNKASGTMSVFDPAGVSVAVPAHYSMEELEARRWRCKVCGKTADELTMVAFDGNMCIPCKQAQLAALG